MLIDTKPAASLSPASPATAAAPSSDHRRTMAPPYDPPAGPGAGSGSASAAAPAPAQAPRAPAAASRHSFDDDEGYGIDSYQAGTGGMPPPYVPPAPASGTNPPPGHTPAPSVSRTFGAGISPSGRPAGTTAYSSSQGWSISNLCWASWALPPFSSVLVLIYETENDLARFHAYQAGVCGIAWIVLFWILRSLFGWKALSVIFFMGGLGWFWVCGSAAAENAPSLQRVPYIAYAAPLAEDWLAQE